MCTRTLFSIYGHVSYWLCVQPYYTVIDVSKDRTMYAIVDAWCMLQDVYMDNTVIVCLT